MMAVVLQPTNDDMPLMSFPGTPYLCQFRDNAFETNSHEARTPSLIVRADSGEATVTAQNNRTHILIVCTFEVCCCIHTHAELG